MTSSNGPAALRRAIKLGTGRSRVQIAVASLLCVAATAQAQQAPAPSFGFFAINVADLPRAEKYYVEGVGMKRAIDLSKPGDGVQEIGLNFTGNPASGGPLLILVHYTDPKRIDANRSSGAKIGFVVADTHAAASRLRAQGYTVLREPRSDAKGLVLNTVARDPDGVIVELTELRGIPRR